MVFEKITKSLKGVTTTLTDTVSDGFDTLSSPIKSVSNSLTGSSEFRDSVEDTANHDQYKHWRYSECKKLYKNPAWSGLAVTKKALFQEMMQYLIEKPIENSWTSWISDHTTTLKSFRKQIQKGVLDAHHSHAEKDKDNKKTLSFPQKGQADRVTSFDEFVMNCEQALRDLSNHTNTLSPLVQPKSVSKHREIIRTHSKNITKKTFGIFSSQGKLGSVVHTLIKHIKQKQSLEELKASAFTGEGKRYEKKIDEVDSKISLLYTTERKEAYDLLSQEYAFLEAESSAIEKQRNEVVAIASEYHSQKTLEETKLKKTTIDAIKERTKKIKLMNKKLVSYQKTTDKQIKELDTVAKKDIKSLEKSWTQWQESYTTQTQNWYSTVVTTAATGLWQIHILGGYHYSLETYASYERSHDKETVSLSKIAQGEFDLVYDLMKKLLRDLRKLEADIVSQQESSKQVIQYTKDIKTLLDAGEKLMKSMTESKTATRRSITQLEKSLSDNTASEKKHTKESESMIAQGYDHTYQTCREIIKSLKDEHLKAQQRLSDLGSNKKMSLPQTSDHSKVRKAMRAYSEILEKKVEEYGKIIDWLTSRKISDKKTKVVKSDTYIEVSSLLS